MDKDRVILHSDMNAFFASVEQRADPRLRGKPVAVAGSGLRSVVTTASYEARPWGVRTGMTVGQALRVCPGLVVVPVDAEKYADTAARLVSIYQEFTPCVEVFSIDEAFLDVTGSLRRWGTPESIARAIKERIRVEVGLTCSIGIAPNKVLAKLASDLQKPDGLVRVRMADVPQVIWPLPVQAICGVGPRTAAVLRVLGLERIGQLAAFPEDVLRARLGVVGADLRRWAWGEDNRPVVPQGDEGAPSSIGHSTTLDEDVAEPVAQERVLLHLSEMVGRRARRAGLGGRTIAVTIRYPDFETFTRHRTVAEAIDDSQVIFDVARSILRGLRLRAPVRLFGVRLTNLEKSGIQGDLFAPWRKRRALIRAMDDVNDRFGEFTVRWGAAGASLDAETPRGLERVGSILSPSWRPPPGAERREGAQAV
ncbi:MAG: DNA polymerase IV [Planctomycetes bacterium]|nr:DNA polymerase IV [Planctomycetota bacterium]